MIDINFYKTVEPIILEAGEMLKDFWEKRNSLKINYKEGQGLVSIADKEVEKFLIQKLKALRPDSSFCAEESSYENDYDIEKLKNGFSWMIDPLDGTNNFLSGFDYFSISVALCFNGLPQLGIVYRPIRGDYFYAVKGNGAVFKNIKLNESEILLSKNLFRPDTLKETLLSTGFAGEKGISFEKEFEIFKNVMMNSRGIRRLGSAALDLCYTAKGSWHGFWEKGLAPWDVAAGALICQEAGLDVFDLESASFTPFNKTIVVCSSKIKQELLKILN